MKLEEVKNLLSMTREIRRKNIEIMSDKLTKHDITYEQWIVLSVIYEHSNAAQRIVAEITHKDKSTLTRILDQLENKKLIQRTTDKKDRRSFILKITEDGEAIVVEILPIQDEMHSIMFGGITDEDIAHIIYVFSRVLNNTEEELRRIN